MKLRCYPRTLHPMKTLKISILFVVIAVIATAGVMYGNQGIAFFSNASKAQAYQNLLQPEIGSYYSVQSMTKKQGSVFVIGKKVSPQVGGTVTEKGELITIEVPPASGTGLVKGSYVKVIKVREVLTTKYFNGARDVVQDALDN